MLNLRDDEPEYSRLRRIEARECNAFGNPIDLIASSTTGAGTSMYINADSSVGETYNRNKQHGFHFTADNCIGCHACEAACSEKNDLPAHLSFRSVGYVEGGTYPDFQRLNLSMACNHCDDPVCLKGCPTNAYTKHAEYGAVLQDPDTCFGCGYCTWVCPYNAPQLDPMAGHVQKCNMCVDRLEVGLKPACVSACVGNALDFGVIDSTPDNREQIKTAIPGFPDPSISKPNIRFQQTRSLPREFTRTDSAPIKYHRNDASGAWEPTYDAKGNGTSRQWNLRKLSSRENPLVIFTLTTQAVVGAFTIAFAGTLLGLPALATLINSGLAAPFVGGLIALQAAVLFLSTQHLGKPWRFYRGFNNLRFSPLSREALAVSLFFALLMPIAGLLALRHGVAGLIPAGLIFAPSIPSALFDTLIGITVTLAMIAGILGIYFMNRIYRIKARPFWDHWQVLTAFFGTCLSQGALMVAYLSLPLSILAGVPVAGLWSELLPILFTGLLIEALGHIAHVRDLRAAGREGAASLQVMTTRFGRTWQLRNGLLAAWLVLGATLWFAAPHIGTAAAQGLLLACAVGVTATALISRALFYVIVIPTTMPGAFFWKNKGFEEHARETGLAKMPQVGVVEYDH